MGLGLGRGGWPGGVTPQGTAENADAEAQRLAKGKAGEIDPPLRKKDEKQTKSGQWASVK